MFDNKLTNGGIYSTRYIMSWVREGGKLRRKSDIDSFKKWLLSMGLAEDEVKHITFLATNGKMELEYSARVWLEEHKD